MPARATKSILLAVLAMATVLLIGRTFVTAQRAEPAPVPQAVEARAPEVAAPVAPVPAPPAPLAAAPTEPARSGRPAAPPRPAEQPRPAAPAKLPPLTTSPEEALADSPVIPAAPEAPAPEAAPETPQSVEALLRRMREKYESTGALRARFTQTMTSGYAEGAASLSGTLTLKGEQYRVETKDQTIVTDRRTTWVYVPAENQVLVNDYAEDETAFSPGKFFTTYPDNYKTALVGTETIAGKKHFVLRLTPNRKDAFLREVTLWLRDADTIVTRVQVVDQNETTMVFNLSNIELNPALTPDTFRFSPPQGVEVIDLRS